jgi:transcriptional regulator with XRE-family HTH domain
MPSNLHSARYEKFRKALIAERNVAGLTQADLAQRLKKPQSFISKFERGERRLDVLEFIDIATAIGFSPSSFIGNFER